MTRKKTDRHESDQWNSVRSVSSVGHHPNNYCCPQCKGGLGRLEGGYRCDSCARTYPVVLGIPDFRVFPDPYISYEDDYRKAQYLVEHARDLDFAGMLWLYWTITPQVSADRAARFVRHALALAERGEAKLAELEAAGVSGRALLEVGCGTGGLLVAACRRYPQVIGVDIAFRWLAVARRRLAEAGAEAPLVCACAEALPFPEGSFDLIVAEDVLDHVAGQGEMLRECHRVARRDGMLYLTTPNRFSLAREPHVHVWGVGFWPRRWMDRYVRWARGIPYEFLRVLSFLELKRLLEDNSFPDHRISAPLVPEAKCFSAGERMLVAIYDLVRRTPVLRWGLYLVGPFFEVVGHARKEE